MRKGCVARGRGEEGDGRGWEGFEGRERERERVTGYLFGQAKYFSPPDVLRC